MDDSTKIKQIKHDLLEELMDAIQEVADQLEYDDDYREVGVVDGLHMAIDILQDKQEWL